MTNIHTDLGADLRRPDGLVDRWGRKNYRVMADGSSLTGEMMQQAGSVFDEFGREVIVLDDPDGALGGGAGAVPYTFVEEGGDVQAALDEAMHVQLGPGEFQVSTAYAGKFDGQTLQGSPGTVIKPSVIYTGSLVQTTGFDDWTLRDVELDLNDASSIGARIRGTQASPISGARMINVRAHNKATPTVFVGALYIAWCDQPYMENCRVWDYGYSLTGSANISYAHYFENCTRGLMVNPRTNNGRVGVEFWECYSCVARDGASVDCTDNGIYCTGDEGSGNKFINMLIERCEEGCVISTDDSEVLDTTFIDNTNTGVTCRGVARGRIAGCRFRGNNRHISDDSGLAHPGVANDYWQIKGNVFEDVEDTEIMLQLRRFKRTTVSGNKFTKTTGTGQMIVITGSTDGSASGDGNVISDNDFDDVNKTITASSGMVRIDVSNGLSNNNEVADNRVYNGNTFVRVVATAGTPGTGTTVRRTRKGAGLTNEVTRFDSGATGGTGDGATIAVTVEALGGSAL